MRSSYFTLFLAQILMMWQTGGFAQTPPQPTVTTSAPAALALLDATIKSLTRPEGVEVQFHQTVFGNSDPATLTGTSITAAGKKVYFDLKYQQVKRQAQLKLLCDGETFHRLESISDNNTIISYPVQELQDVMKKLATSETERVAMEDVEKTQLGLHGFEGISAMISDLKRRMIFGEPTSATIDLPGKPRQAVKVIEGRWNSDALEQIAPTKKTNAQNQQDQRYLWNEKLSFFLVPRLAKLYFIAATGELVRLELWGITEKQGPEKVLLNMDILSTVPLTTLDAKLFRPTEEELKYQPMKYNLEEAIKNQHLNMMNMLKQQQQQSPKK
ncbi:MAG TPA: hypothetical protein PLN21_12200 [Gemmatales bacterium]|nr:hypothetical protein [Gemmatales bacterium]